MAAASWAWRERMGELSLVRQRSISTRRRHTAFFLSSAGAFEHIVFGLQAAQALARFALVLLADEAYASVRAMRRRNPKDGIDRGELTALGKADEILTDVE